MQSITPRSYGRLGVVLALLALCACALWAEPLLKTGDRMVFLGDSITEQRIYTRYVMDYFTLRYPGVAIAFRNAGWGGDTAPGGLNRLQRDVLALNPTVVSICFGMNDGGYRAFDQGAFDRYMKGMTGLVESLKKANVTVVLLTPGCVDPDRRPALRDGNYNDTLAKFGAGVKELAAKEHLPVFDLNALMLDAQTKAKAADPQFTMIPDAVHPSPLGQAVMAYGLLKALGCTEQPSSLAIDAAAGTAKPDRCTVQDLKVADTGITFTRTDAALPAYFDPEATPIFKFVPVLDELNLYRFQVTGLKAGAWKLAVEDMEVGTFTHEQLAAGVNLAALPGPWQKLGQQVNSAAMDHENLYYFRWRQVGLGRGIPDEAQVEVQALCKKLDQILDAREQARIKLTENRTWKWALAFVPAV